MKRTLTARVLPGFLTALFLTIVPIVAAIPQVLPQSQSLIDVGTDARIYFLSTIDNVPIVGQFSIQSPNGTSWTRTFALDAGPLSSQTCGPNTLDGVSYDLNEQIPQDAPADGTWIFSGQVDHNGRVVACLSVAGKSISFCLPDAAQNSINYQTENPQLWNYRMTAGDFVDDGTPTCPVSPGPFLDPVVQADEDPNNAVFFGPDQPQAPPTGETAPAAFTVNSTVACSTSLHVSGAFGQAINVTSGLPPSNIWSWFAWVDGPQTTTDLRTVLGAQELAKVNHGLAINGTSNRTVTYNNAAGTSYQFFANNSYGEALGQVLYAPPLQCTQADVPSTGNLEHDNNAFEVEVSHAQCRGDRVSVSASMQDNPSGLQEHLTTLFIIDALTNDTVLTFNTSTMYRTGPSSIAHSHFNSTVLLPGPYILVGIADYTGIGAVDYIDSEAFNVPQNACDASDELPAINSQFTEIRNRLNNLSQSIINEINNINGTDGGIIPLSAFTNLTSGDSSLLVLFLVLMILFLWQEKRLPAFACLLGILIVFVDAYYDPTNQDLPFEWDFAFLLVVLTLWIEYARHGWREHKLEKRKKVETEHLP